MVKTIGKWCLIKENGKNTVRRWVNISGKSKLERLPIKKYRHLRENEEELKLFLLRINASFEHERVKNVIQIRHAFIDDKLQESYREYLKAQITNHVTANLQFHYTKNHFLNFFINTLGLQDPLEWHRVHKTEWTKHLSHTPSSVSAKKQVIIAANKFMAWLHDQRPNEVPPLKFTPFTKSRFKEMKSSRKLRGEEQEGMVILDRDLDIILKDPPKDIASLLYLCYHFGLRKSEALGLTLLHVKRNYLYVDQQLVGFKNSKPRYDITKGREPRCVPYWSCDAELAYKWISEMTLMHTRTFSRKWEIYIDKLKMSYKLHDFRHTWITKYINTRSIPREVQLAVGHKNIQTTMGYVHDTTKLDNEIYIPKKIS